MKTVLELVEASFHCDGPLERTAKREKADALDAELARLRTATALAEQDAKASQDYARRAGDALANARARLATARNDALEEVLRLVQKKGECWYEGGGAESDTGAWNCPKEQKGECLCYEWGDLAEAIRALKTPASVAGDGGA